ncbi:MAG: spermidine/putrescine ABC transporter substrate-binding protein, partial [Oscillospiraceae bacterium]|nr:spermidine/putrescine ABC transporter substrate-binding protein [Oscillospiraceae bacterium]
FYRPLECFNLFIDAMCIPSCAQEKEAAELFINFLCDPEIAAGNMEWICYSTPLKMDAVSEFMDEEILADPNAYPSQEELERGTSFDSLPAAVSRLMESLFLKARIS